jgi:hypothetical protein
VEHKLLTIPEHMSSPPFLSGDNVVRSLDFYSSFIDLCLSFPLSFFYGYCIVCPSSSSDYDFAICKLILGVLF